MATSSDSIPGQEFVDFDEFIEIQLQKTRSTIKSTEMMTAGVGVAALLTFYLLAFVIFDHWVVPGGFNAAWRTAMLGVVVAVSAVWLSARVVLPWRRRVSGLYAANTIEAASGGLKSSLINLVDLSGSKRKVPDAIYGAIERRAALALAHVDVHEAVDRRSLLQTSIALLSIVVISCLYVILSPKSAWTSLRRAVVPTADVRVATRTEILSVRPGNTDVLARSQLEVTADLRGEIPAQTQLYFTTSDGKYVDEAIEMRLVDETAKQFRCVITGDNGAGILQDMTYRVVAGDSSTQPYRVRVIQPPSATIDSIQLTAPEYMRREPVTQTSGRIDAWDGTRVTLTATANMPLKSALLQFFDDETTATVADEIPIRLTGGMKLDVAWKLEVRSDGTSPHHYRILCQSADGQADPNPSLYALTIRPDQPPEIVLRDPRGDLELPANAVLPLVIEARDPDFGLRYINLKVEKNGSPIIGPEIYEGNDRQFSTTFDWPLKAYQCSPKDTITFWVQAQDNRQPLANTANTPKLKIRIIEPVSDDQVKKQLEHDKQRQKDDLRKSEPERPADAKPGDKQPGDPQRKPPGAQAEPPKKGQEKEDGREQRPPNAGGKKETDGHEQNGDKNQPRDADPNKTDPTKTEKDGTKGRESGADGEDRQGAPDPNNPADDSKVLQKLIDEQRKKDKPGDDNATGLEKRKDQRPSDDSEQHDPKDKDKEQKSSSGTDEPAKGDPKTDGSQQPSSAGGEKDAPGSQDRARQQAQKEGQDPSKNGAADGNTTKPRPGDDPDAKKKSGEQAPNGDKKEDPSATHADPSTKNDQKQSNDDRPDAGREKKGDPDGRPQEESQRKKDAAEPPASADKKSDDQQPKAADKKNGGRDQDRTKSDATDPKDSEKRGDKKEASEQKASEQKGSEQKGSEQKGSEQKGSEQKGSEQKGSEQKGSEQKGSEQKGSEQKGSEQKGSEQKGSEQKGSEQKGSEQKGSEQKGSEQKGSEQKGSEQKGDGDQGSKTGDKGKKGDGTPQPEGKGKPSDADAKRADSKPADADAKDDAKEAAGEPGNPSKGSAPGGPAGKGENPGGGGPANLGGGKGGGKSKELKDTSADANLDFAKQATDLALRRIENQMQRGEVDKKLLEDLGWTEEQMRLFVERMRRQAQSERNPDAPESVARRLQFQETLRSLDLRPNGQKRTGASVIKRQVDEIGGKRPVVPPEFRDQYEAYTRSINMSKRPPPNSGSK